MHIFDDFTDLPNSHWTQVCTGGGILQQSQSILKMGYRSAKEGRYTDAQIDDYTMLARSHFLWKPPLRMTLRARFSLPAAPSTRTSQKKDFLKGTAGFGFWNKPFSMQGDIFTLPEAVWFFHASPPSNMALVPEVAGWGWKAQVIHTRRISAFPHIIPLALTAAFGRLTGKTRPASRWMQKFAGAYESLITSDMTKWHTYTLEWQKNESLFWVDEQLILRAPIAPTHSLGFVAWLDNEYAIATPHGELRFGTVSAGSQWLDMDSVTIKSL